MFQPPTTGPTLYLETLKHLRTLLRREEAFGEELNGWDAGRESRRERGALHGPQRARRRHHQRLERARRDLCVTTTTVVVVVVVATVVVVVVSYRHSSPARRRRARRSR